MSNPKLAGATVLAAIHELSEAGVGPSFVTKAVDALTILCDRIRELEELDRRWRPMATAPDGPWLELLCVSDGSGKNDAQQVIGFITLADLRTKPDYIRGTMDAMAWRPAHSEWHPDWNPEDAT